MSATPEQIEAMLRRAYGQMVPGSAHRVTVREAERRGRSICAACKMEFTPSRNSRFCSRECYFSTFPKSFHEYRRRREEAGWEDSPEGLLAEMEDALERLRAFVREQEDDE